MRTWNLRNGLIVPLRMTTSIRFCHRVWDIPRKAPPLSPAPVVCRATERIRCWCTMTRQQYGHNDNRQNGCVLRPIRRPCEPERKAAFADCSVKRIGIWQGGENNRFRRFVFAKHLC
jgi:hypothetical protein